MSSVTPFRNKVVLSAFTALLASSAFSWTNYAFAQQSPDPALRGPLGPSTSGGSDGPGTNSPIPIVPARPLGVEIPGSAPVLSSGSGSSSTAGTGTTSSGRPALSQSSGVPQPAPGSTLDQLYPQPTNASTPYASEQNDPTLSSIQKDEASTVALTPIPSSELLPIGGGKLPPIGLEATFNEPVSLPQVLKVALNNNLAIRISQAGYDSQKYLFAGALGRFLPDFTQTYRGQRIQSEGSVPSQIFTDSTTLRFPVFQGGRIVYGATVSFYRARAARNAYSASINDVLLDAYRRYFELLLAQSLLQIRVKSVELSRTQLRLNQQLKDAGVGTNFAVYQSRTQLALDKQALLQQQVLVRQASLQLARILNTSMAINLIPRESQVREVRLVRQSTAIADLMATTMKLRPELKQFEDLRLAARRNVQVAQSALYPTFQFFTSVTHTESFRSNYTQNFQNQVKTNAQNQMALQAGQTPSSSSSSSGGNSAAGLGGSTVIIPTGGGGGGIGVSGSGGRNVSAGFDLSWNLASMGVPDAANTMSAQALARQALLQSNQTLLNVEFEVRSSYLNMLTAKEQIDVAAEALVSAAEQLRLANLRVTYGQGINLELIQAQREYVTALTNHVQAIINFNISQAQLLRDTGQISLTSLTNEYARPIGIRKVPHGI